MTAVSDAGVEDPLRRVRECCLGFADTIERDSHGAPAWWIRGGRSFALFADHHRDDRLGVWCASDTDTQQELISRHPDRFYRPPYLGWRGWLGISLDGEVRWSELEDLLRTAHALVAARGGS